MPERDPTQTIPPWLDRLLDGLVWAVSLSFAVTFFFATSQVGLWERILVCVFAFFIPFFMIGTVVIIVRRIIETK